MILFSLRAYIYGANQLDSGTSMNDTSVIAVPVSSWIAFASILAASQRVMRS